MTSHWDAWMRVAVVSQPVLLLSSGLVVVALTWAVLVLAAAATMTLAIRVNRNQ